MSSPTHIQGGIRPKHNPGRIHEEQVGVPEAFGLNCPENVGGIAARDTAQDIGRRNRRIIQEIGNVVRRNSEFAETMEKVGPATGPRSSGNVVLDRSIRQVYWCTHLGVETRGGDGRRNLSIGHSPMNTWVAHRRRMPNITFLNENKFIFLSLFFFDLLFYQPNLLGTSSMGRRFFDLEIPDFPTLEQSHLQLPVVELVGLYG